MQKFSVRIAFTIAAILAVAGTAYFIHPNNVSLAPKTVTTNNAATNSAPFEVSKEREYWSKQIDTVGAEQAYTEFKQAFATQHFGIQHMAAHMMGALLYEKTGVNGLTICDGTFSFGCYHSFFGKALSENGLAVMKKLDKACVDKYGPLGTGCLHGIGHGLVEYLGHDRLSEALAACNMTTQVNPLFGCTSGVFMEYNLPTIIDGQNTSMAPRAPSNENPYEPCNTTVPKQFQKSCYYELVQWWSGVYGNDFAKIGRLCHAISTQNYRETCYLGIGNMIAPTSNYTVENAIAKCSLMPEKESELICRSGASWGFFVVPAYRHLAPSLCKNLADSTKDNCLKKSDLTGTGEILRIPATNP